jgi:pyruvate dehydrogenase E2 component (dihydrolipoamide acetyltransferase)
LVSRQLEDFTKDVTQKVTVKWALIPFPNADSLSVAEIAAATAALAEKAKTGTLTREDISGGSFTVSNLGMLGVGQFTAIINPPMGAILALGKGEQKMVAKDGEPAVATVMSATLSCDHRIIDGATGAKFLQVLGEVFAECAQATGGVRE